MRTSSFQGAGSPNRGNWTLASRYVVTYLLRRGTSRRPAAPSESSACHAASAGLDTGRQAVPRGVRALREFVQLLECDAWCGKSSACVCHD